MIMRTTRGWLACGLALLYASTAIAQAADGWTEYRARPGAGNKIVIDGTANMIHEKWKVQGLIIGGSVEVGPNFPTDPASAKPGKLDVKSTVRIPVRSLKSIEDDGRPYSANMDNIMYEHLKMEEHKEITFTLGSLTLKEVKDGAYQCEAEGDLTVAGVTKKITMPVEVSAPEANRLRFAGKVDVKMTDFGINPPAPALALGAIKTGDEVKLTFEWIAVKR
jgi:polyisoprenoid-binding protein YceI